MNRLSPLSVPAERLVLTGGRVPLAWQRSMKAREAWLKEWLLISSWIQPLTSLRPRLRDGLLLGPYLSALTDADDVEGASQSSEEAAEAATKRAAWSRYRPDSDRALSPPTSTERNALAPEKRERVKASDGTSGTVTAKAKRTRAEQTTAQRQPGVHQLAPQAGRALLRELAGDAALDGNSVRVQGRRSAMALRPQRKAAVPASGNAAARQEWLHALVRRSVDALYSVPAPAPDQEANLLRELSFPDPWKTPVTGRPAPQGTLAHLAGVQASNHRQANRKQQAAESSSRTEGVGDGGSGNAGPGGTHSSRPSDANWLRRAETAGVGGRESGRGDGGRSAVAEPGAYPTGANHLQVDGDGARSRQHSPVQPPTVAPSLPTLRTPSSSRDPASPLASSMIRQEGVQEREAGDVVRGREAGAQDELIALSDKVRRILTEEARRFGIDV